MSRSIVEMIRTCALLQQDEPRGPTFRWAHAPPSVVPELVGPYLHEFPCTLYYQMPLMDEEYAAPNLLLWNGVRHQPIMQFKRVHNTVFPLSH